VAAENGPLRLALAQLDTTVGDIAGNAQKVGEWVSHARDAGAQLVLFPELSICGYPPEDLLLKPHFLEASARGLDNVAAEVSEIVALVGFPERFEGATYNSLAVLADREVQGVYRKMRLPNYGVFDEGRYFQPGLFPTLIELNGVPIGVTVCEDIWLPGPPEAEEAAAGAVLVVNASASPYHRGKGAEREAMVAERARDCGAAIALCNAVGGQDELVFDGHSVFVSAEGETLARGAQFHEELVLCELMASGAGEAAGAGRGAEVPTIARATVNGADWARRPELPASPLEDKAEVYEALKLGLRDYVDKNGFERVLVALSGGIDSALVALIATDALGPERVTCVIMPSPHSSVETQADARRIAAHLGVDVLEIPIEDAMTAYEQALAESFSRDSGPAGAPAGEAAVRGLAPGLAEENVQARIRGNLMMALSNKFGWLVLTTGNKSEMSVGYATLYGDMAGGFAVIKDVPKTLVYEMVRHRCGLEERELIPASVLARAPSAELRPGQRDEDSLPPYDLLDRILEAYVERDTGREEMIAEGLPEEVVDRVIRMVDQAEYKRRQAPPGVRISPKAFGRDRRLPITNRFRG
jgi:NAD+ synthase (glutamine-hydrolysing)